MKILLTAAALCATMAMGNTADSTLSFKNDKEKKEKKKDTEKTVPVRNFHSVNNWKITIDYFDPENKSQTPAPLDLFSIEVAVSWISGKHEKSYTLSTLKMAETNE